MQFIKKHIDGIVGVGAFGWGSIVVLVPAASPLGDYVAPAAAFAFGVVAFGRWYAALRK